MFKFYTKGDDNNLEAAIFYNGQRIATVYSWRYTTGQITIQVENGSGMLETEWTDYEETD